MIDKLDLLLPNGTQFSPSFGRLYSELRSLRKGPFHSSKLYEQVGDLREYGHQVRLGMYCQMDRVGNHKIELIDVGEMSRDDILREISSIFDIDGRKLGIMRVDFAVNIKNVPLQWFRETVRVENKRFRAAVTGERFYSEMGTGQIQTLYFGKRPNVIRIYDKQAESYRSIRRETMLGLAAIPSVSPFGMLARRPDSGGHPIALYAVRGPAIAPASWRLGILKELFRGTRKPAVIYTRVSSREQQQEGFSLGAQTKLLREYADRNGLQIVKAFEDVETAKASGRVQFSEMVTWFKRNRGCGILLVEKTDRRYRNLRDAVTLEDLDIEAHLVKEGQTISKDSKSQAKLVCFAESDRKGQIA